MSWLAVPTDRIRAYMGWSGPAESDTMKKQQEHEADESVLCENGELAQADENAVQENWILVTKSESDGATLLDLETAQEAIEVVQIETKASPESSLDSTESLLKAQGTNDIMEQNIGTVRGHRDLDVCMTLWPILSDLWHMKTVASINNELNKLRQIRNKARKLTGIDLKNRTMQSFIKALPSVYFDTEQAQEFKEMMLEWGIHYPKTAELEEVNKPNIGSIRDYRDLDVCMTLWPILLALWHMKTFDSIQKELDKLRQVRSKARKLSGDDLENLTVQTFIEVLPSVYFAVKQAREFKELMLEWGIEC